MSFSIVQTAPIQHGTSTTASASFSANTTSGNLLVAVLAYGSGTTPASGPSGWTQAVNETDGQNGIVIYYLDGASSISSGTSLTASLGYSGKWVLALIEVSGAATTGALSQTVTSSSTGTTGSITEGGAAIFIGGVVDFDGTRTYSAGTGTTIFAQASEGTNSHTSCNLAALYAIKTSGSTTALTVTNGSQTGCMASFSPQTNGTISLATIPSSLTMGTLSVVQGPPDSCVCNTFTTPIGGVGLAFTGSVTPTTNQIGGVGLRFTGSVQATCRTSWYPWSSVWLLQEIGDGTTGEYQDVTGHYPGTGGSGKLAATPFQDAGVFCRYSQDFASKQFIEFPPDTIRPDQAFTVTLWANIHSTGAARTFFSRGSTTSSGDQWVTQFGYTVNNQLLAQVQYLDEDGAPQTLRCQAYSQLTRETWYLLAMVWIPGESLSVYVDGVLARQVDATHVPETVPLTNSVWVGRFNAAQLPNANLQDVRIYPRALSPDYLTAMRANLCDTGFYTVSTETTV